MEAPISNCTNSWAFMKKKPIRPVTHLLDVLFSPQTESGLRILKITVFLWVYYLWITLRIILIRPANNLIDVYENHILWFHNSSIKCIFATVSLMNRFENDSNKWPNRVEQASKSLQCFSQYPVVHIRNSTREGRSRPK